MASANSEEQYRHKWDHMFQERAHFEWHCDFEIVSSLLRPYFQAALAAEGDGGERVLLDVGCGSSSLCVDFFKQFSSHDVDGACFSKLVLTDVSPYIINVLKDRYKNDPAIKGSATLHTVDCRDLRQIGIKDASVCAVLEKGTIDAMDGEDDKAAIFRECLRVVSRNGVFVSISFPAVARLELLESEVNRWNKTAEGVRLALHTHVVGSGDPARGGTVVFVAVIGGCGVLEAAGYAPSALTQEVLARARRSGSVMEEAPAEDADVDVFGDL